MDSTLGGDEGELETFAVASRMLYGGKGRADVLNALAHSRRLSYQDLVDETGLTKRAIASHIEALEDLGVVSVDPPKAYRPGRPLSVVIDQDLYQRLLAAWAQGMGLRAPDQSPRQTPGPSAPE